MSPWVKLQIVLSVSVKVMDQSDSQVALESAFCILLRLFSTKLIDSNTCILLYSTVDEKSLKGLIIQFVSIRAKRVDKLASLTKIETF